MDIPCKMRGNVQEITFCAQTLPNFVIPYIIVTNVNFFEAGLSMVFSSVQFCLCSCRWRWRSTGFVPNGCAISCWARSVCSFCLGGAERCGRFGIAGLYQLAGRAVAGVAGPQKPLLAVLVLLDLAVLGGFKYAGFAAESINTVVPGLLPVLSPALPLGISFTCLRPSATALMLPWAAPSRKKPL